MTTVPSGSNLYSAGFGTTSSNSFSGSAIRSTRAPTTTDVRGPQGNFPIGQIWVDYVTPAVYVLGTLTSSAGVTSATWLLSALNSGDLETLSGDSGTASPSSSNIQIAGGTGITTSASGSTVTIALSSGGVGIDSITPDSGTTPVVPTAAGLISLTGITNQITTVGGTNAMTIGITDEVQSGSITAIGGVRHLTAIGTISGSSVNNTDSTFVGYQAGTSSTAALRDVAVGSGALKAITTATDNVGVGYNALALNTASGNTAVGASAGATIVAGTGMTAVGYSALSVATGNNNTVVGHSAAGALTTAANATIVGQGSVLGVMTGNNNTVIGQGAGTAATTAASATIVGQGAVLGVMTGANNTVIGQGAAAAATSAASTTVVGQGSLLGVVTGANNTVLGQGSGVGILGGAGNTIVGQGSGLAITTGSSNTIVGLSAGEAFTTGSSNILIGDNAGDSFATADSTNIAVGHVGAAGVSNRIYLGTGGTHTTCFIGGIRGVTTAVNDAVAVLVDSAHQLGTVSSALRYKENVADIEDSDRIYDLHPVKFKYKDHPDGLRPQYGLIAEETYEVIPEIVVHDKDGQADTIQYQTLPIFLLAEVKKLKKEIEELKESKRSSGEFQAGK